MDTAPTPPTMWYRYVDDTMAKIHEHAVDSFSDHLNSIDQHIQFTSEQEKEGKIPFLDTCVHVNQDGSTKISVYRKPTHTDQYLNFHSNHHLQHKRAVVNTLMLRAQTLVTEDEDKTREAQHVKQALKVNNYPDWMLTIPHSKSGTKEPENEKKIYASAPYIKGISERLQRAFTQRAFTFKERSLEKCRKHSPAAHVFYISLVFSNARKKTIAIVLGVVCGVVAIAIVVFIVVRYCKKTTFVEVPTKDLKDPQDVELME
ncbi:hypothetical protein ACROYT_G037786 [Oculina patagonica]